MPETASPRRTNRCAQGRASPVRLPEPLRSIRSRSEGNWRGRPVPGTATPTPPCSGPKQVSSLSLAQLLPGARKRSWLLNLPESCSGSSATYRPTDQPGRPDASYPARYEHPGASCRSLGTFARLRGCVLSQSAPSPKGKVGRTEQATAGLWVHPAATML